MRRGSALPSLSAVLGSWLARARSDCSELQALMCLLVVITGWRDQATGRTVDVAIAEAQQTRAALSSRGGRWRKGSRKRLLRRRSTAAAGEAAATRAGEPSSQARDSPRYRLGRQGVQRYPRRLLRQPTLHAGGSACRGCEVSPRQAGSPIQQSRARVDVAGRLRNGAAGAASPTGDAQSDAPLCRAGLSRRKAP